MSLPYSEAKEGLAAAERRLNAVKQNDEEILPLAGVILPALPSAKRRFARGERRIDVLRLIEALRNFAARHGGGLPHSLDDLTATPIPRDALTGEPFDYRSDGAVAVLTLPDEFAAEKPLVYEIRIAEK